MFTVEIRDKTTKEYLYGVSILKAESEGDAVFQAMCHLSVTAAAIGDVSLLQRVQEGVWSAEPASKIQSRDTWSDAEVSWQFGRSHGLISV